MKIDQVMIKEMMNTSAVGQYAAAVRLSVAWYFIPVVVANSLFPSILNAKQSNQKLYRDRLKRLYSLMVWMAIGVAIPLTFLNEWIIELVYGEAYRLAAKVLMVHVWAGIFVFLGVAFGRYLIAENMTKKAFYRTATGAVANVVLNFLMIPAFGILGAAVATLVAQLIANLLYDLFDGQLRSQFIFKIRSFNPFIIFRNG
jgi:O-antigen/teichoic acid export membrane protein